MARVEWHTAGDRVWEAGLDRGMLYPPEGPGVAWVGLTSVDEENTSTVAPVYYDGTKFNDLVTLGDFEATLRAYTYPDEFFPFDGLAEDENGLYLDYQPHQRFGLSYRTKIHNELGEEVGYKLHVVWNLTAMVSTKTYRTLGLESDPIEFEWKITAIPEELSYFRPTAHIILDSRHIDEWLLVDIEDILYGTDTNDPKLPSMEALFTFIRKWERLIIVDNNDGTWTAIARNPDDITMLSETEFEITSETAIWLDDPTNTHYSISSTDKNEEDIY